MDNGLLYQSRKLQALLLIGANDLDVAVTQAISMEAQAEPILIAEFGKNTPQPSSTTVEKGIDRHGMLG